MAAAIRPDAPAVTGGSLMDRHKHAVRTRARSAEEVGSVLVINFAGVSLQGSAAFTLRIPSQSNDKLTLSKFALCLSGLHSNFLRRKVRSKLESNNHLQSPPTPLVSRIHTEHGCPESSAQYHQHGLRPDGNGRRRVRGPGCQNFPGASLSRPMRPSRSCPGGDIMGLTG